MKQSSQNQAINLLLSAGTLLVLVFLWYVLTPTVIPELVLPSPQTVWHAMTSLGLKLLEYSALTFLRVATGWLLGVLMGMAVGLLMTWNQTIFYIFNPLIEAIRPLPPVALIPFFIIWFGLGAASQIALIALACFMVLAVSTFVAVNNLPPVYLRAAALLGASKVQIYRTIIIPAILPSLVSGFRVAAALAFAVGVAAEFMGAQSGIGFMIMVARRTLETNVILLGTLVLGLESYLLDFIIRRMSTYLCRWTETPIEALQQIATSPLKKQL
jgi:taurine transport system permease protein